MRLPVPIVNLALRLSVRRALAGLDDLAVMRENFDRRVGRFFRVPRDVSFETVDIAVDSRWLRVGIAVPRERERGRVILYLHGGGFVAGSPRTHGPFAAKLARAARAWALIPDYRLTPEHPFPAAVEDTLDAYRYLIERGHAPGAIAVAGDSAGGGLAAALLLAAAEAGLPQPGCLVAYSPWVDMRETADSLTENAAQDDMLPVERMPEVVEAYLDGTPRTEPLASPVLGRFTDPPPALIFASEREILRDDALALAAKLEAAGGEVTLRLRAGLPHAWPVFAGWMRAADHALAESAAFLRRHLAPARGAEPEPPAADPAG